MLTSLVLVSGILLAGQAAEPPTPLPPVLRVKLHTFPDVSMGGVVSHSVVLPEGWTSSGQTEWSGGELSYPQNRFDIVSPEGGRIRFIPALTLSHTEMSNGTVLPQSVPPPRDFPRWVAAAKQQTRPPVSNVVLIDGRRQPKIEEMHAKLQRDGGIPDNGMEREVYVVAMEYDEAGVRRRDEALMLYVRYAPIVNQNLRSQMWSVFTTFVVSAPKDKFEAAKAQLYTIAGAVRPTPQWWTQSQALLAELSRIRMEARWNAIRRRGEQIHQMSDADYARYRKSFSDGAQRDRINAIYETDDFKDTNGRIVHLPMHYKNVFSDGQGNYVLSNDTRDKPGESWNAIQPMK